MTATSWAWAVHAYGPSRHLKATRCFPSRTNRATPLQTLLARKKITRADRAQVRQLLVVVVLPKRHVDAETAIALVDWIQRHNYAAYCSHRRRTLRRLDTS